MISGSPGASAVTVVKIHSRHLPIGYRRRGDKPHEETLRLAPVMDESS